MLTYDFRGYTHFNISSKSLLCARSFALLYACRADSGWISRAVEISTHDLSPMCLAATTAAMICAGNGFPMLTVSNLTMSSSDIWENIAFCLRTTKVNRQSITSSHVSLPKQGPRAMRPLTVIIPQRRSEFVLIQARISLALPLGQLHLHMWRSDCGESGSSETLR